MFDGRVYGSATPIRRILYQPRAVHVGAILSHALRNVFFYARLWARGLGFKAWARHLEDPQRAWDDSRDYINSTVLQRVYRERFDCPEHYTHVVAHVCFTVPSVEARTANLQLEISDATNTTIRAVAVELGAPENGDRDLRLPQGVLDPFAVAGGLYEAILEAPLYDDDHGSFDLDLPGELELELRARAISIFDEGGVDELEITQLLRIDSVSCWLESRR
jgi:hypothetical protein